MAYVVGDPTPQSFPLLSSPLSSPPISSLPLPSPPCRTEIITKVNNFVLLNLSIALLLALIVFVSGIEGGKWNMVSGQGFGLYCSYTL